MKSIREMYTKTFETYIRKHNKKFILFQSTRRQNQNKKRREFIAIIALLSEDDLSEEDQAFSYS